MKNAAFSDYDEEIQSDNELEGRTAAEYYFEFAGKVPGTDQLLVAGTRSAGEGRQLRRPTPCAEWWPLPPPPLLYINTGLAPHSAQQHRHSTCFFLSAHNMKFLVIVLAACVAVACCQETREKRGLLGAGVLAAPGAVLAPRILAAPAIAAAPLVAAPAIAHAPLGLGLGHPIIG
ncbi:uncharacterized protein LOC126116695 [Schistocerca cancellata]|uniref:uncharacterized protein LOC126116695 n=1 Tax=Schistocerca cancellata TaxID=274614 RepID=UPI00211953D9|nr:uncharacterized protein LOC126116695 [Schistocerca cancellata]